IPVNEITPTRFNRRGAHALKTQPSSRFGPSARPGQQTPARSTLKRKSALARYVAAVNGEGNSEYEARAGACRARAQLQPSLPAGRGVRWADSRLLRPC